LPAIALHGTFDFTLFLTAAFEFMYNRDSLMDEILSMVFSLVLTILGAYWAYREYTNVQSMFDSGWSIAAADEEANSGL
jgi:hypothetical protein